MSLRSQESAGFHLSSPFLKGAVLSALEGGTDKSEPKWELIAG